MKSICLHILFLLFALNSVTAQVAINEDDSDGDASAELDIKSTTKGVIFPVMTQAQRDLIDSPVAGLLIFNATDEYHNFYDGTSWIQIDRTSLGAAANIGGAGTDVGVGVGIADPDNSAILHVSDVTRGFLLPRIDPADPAPIATTGLIYYDEFANVVVYHNGTDFTAFSRTSEASAGAVGAGTSDGLLIGTGTIDASAKMEVNGSSGKGLLIPRMTSGQRDAILSPAEGLTIYNTDDNEIQYYASVVWYAWTEGSYPLGLASSNPGQSCKDIYDNNPSSVGVDGEYYIDPDGVGVGTPYLATCDMTRNGGGWTLVFNSGPKGTNMENTGVIGSMPILTTASSPAAKLSDADIDLVRGVLASSILWVEQPFGNGSETDIFFKQNTAYKADAAVHANSIYTWNLVYADAVTSTGMTVNGARTNSGALHNWDAADNSGIILSWQGEEFISDSPAENDCGATAALSREVCNGLIWVKDP